MNSIYYRDYHVSATSLKGHADQRWLGEVMLVRACGKPATAQSFAVSNTFTTKAEAIRNCLLFGRQIIDGEYRGLTAP